MIFFQKILCKVAAGIIITACVIATTASADSADSIADHWGKLHAKLDDTLTLLAEKQTLPESTWNPFKEDKQSLDKKINDLLEEAVEILNISDLSSTKQQINQCQTDITNYKAMIAELRTKKMMAPKDTAAWKVWENDVSDYEDKIISYKENISAKEQTIAELKIRLQEQFSKQGIDLDSEQLDTLIYSVTGDDDIEIISVYNNIKAITAKLRDLTAESGENIETAKRYYGMHALLLKILINLQQSYVDRVDGQYMPELSAIEKNNQQLIQKTRSLLSTSEPQHKKIYQANLDAQQITDRTVLLYRQYLNKNKTRMNRSRTKIFKEYQAAENTYMTVSTAYTLIAMMRDADNLFNSINELQIPDLLTFDNKAMKAEFKKLSGRMEKETP
jgi:hypothetical protein